ncbi:hypothetical protein TNCT_258031 [Trichonephila clavata]|uniref:Uncharacterized protein n=1 Tax=Trichonephila clavata TaxID=2740835 RepID=A0A8X6IJV3_TRICU|nr:hypothetical protein TNCT_258031 [Trichonephila clavata]
MSLNFLLLASLQLIPKSEEIFNSVDHHQLPGIRERSETDDISPQSVDVSGLVRIPSHHSSSGLVITYQWGAGRGFSSGKLLPSGPGAKERSVECVKKKSVVLSLACRRASTLTHVRRRISLDRDPLFFRCLYKVTPKIFLRQRENNEAYISS